MGMTSLNISLPQPLKDFLEERVKERGYSTPSEYVRELLREDQKRRIEERLEALLLEGLNSGMSAQIRQERGDYYRILERTQQGTMDVTLWMEWFLGCLTRAIKGAQAALSSVITKAR
jgi:antitoxin ParD1/3/4